MATMLVAPKPFYEIEGDIAASQQQQQAEIGRAHV